MGDILDLIKSRRTIKHFLPKFVSWDKVSRIVDAGRHAPSSGNIQNWKFIVFFDPDKKAQLAQLTYDQYDIAMAGVLIVICSEVEKAIRYYGVRGERLYAIQNCAAAMQNMVLEAQSLGLGSAWIGAFDEEGVKTLCGIPEEVRPQGIIAVGYAAEVPGKPPKYPMEMMTYFHGWRHRYRDVAKYMHSTAAIIARKAHKATTSLKEGKDFLVDKMTESLSKNKDESRPEE
jgi:nitroreductase